MSPPPLLVSDTKKQQKGRSTDRSAVLIAAFLVLLGILYYASSGDDAPSQPAMSEEQRAAAAKQKAFELAKREEEETAKKKAEEARKREEEVKCKTDLRCIAEKNSIEATVACQPYVERLAKNNFEWTDKWYEPKFSHFRWKDQKTTVITYMGDKIKYQNGFGAWTFSRYECDYSVPGKAVLDVRAFAGRM